MFSSNHVLATTPHLGNDRILTYILSTVNGAGCRTRTDTLFDLGSWYIVSTRL